jgi:trigger factor
MRFSARSKEEITDEQVFKWTGYKDKDEFTQAVKAELLLNKFMQRKKSMEDTIIKTLLEKLDFDVPEVLVNRQKEIIVENEIKNLRRRQVSEDDIKKHKEDIEKKSLEIAIKNVKLYYILDAIAKKENLNISQNNIYEVVISHILTLVLK